MKDFAEAQIIFLQIINSYSFFNHIKYGDVYIRHPSKFELLNFEKQYIKTLEDAKNKGIPTFPEREKIIIEEGLWTKQQEIEISNNQKMIDGMRDQITHSYLHSKRKLFRREMLDAESRLNTLLLKKDYFIGQTAEKIASKQSIYFRVVNSLFRDDKFNHKLIKEELNEEEYNELSDEYFKQINKINLDIIKKIAISQFFTSMYYMCDDNAYFFYGKPLIQLTDYQINLLMYGKYFKNLMSQYGDRLPEEMSETPDDIIEWFEITKNVEKSGILEDKEEENTSSTSITGATKHDLKLMGVNPSQIVDMGSKISRNSKGFLDKNDLYAMS